MTVTSRQRARQDWGSRGPGFKSRQPDHILAPGPKPNGLERNGTELAVVLGAVLVALMCLRLLGVHRSPLARGRPSRSAAPLYGAGCRALWATSPRSGA